MNVLGRLVLNSRKDSFFVRCRRTYVLNNFNQITHKKSNSYSIHKDK